MDDPIAEPLAELREEPEPAIFLFQSGGGNETGHVLGIGRGHAHALFEQGVERDEKCTKAVGIDEHGISYIWRLIDGRGATLFADDFIGTDRDGSPKRAPLPVAGFPSGPGHHCDARTGPRFSAISKSGCALRTFVTFSPGGGFLNSTVIVPPTRWTAETPAALNARGGPARGAAGCIICAQALVDSEP